MDPSAPSLSAAPAPGLPLARPDAVSAKPAPTPAAEAAAQHRAEEQAAHSAKILPGHLVIEKDDEAGRFVSTLIDSQTQEVERRYPNDTQLAFSRAVAAYVRAMSES